MVIEEEGFDDITLTDGATFSTDFIKIEKTRVNQKITFPCDKKRHIQ